MINKITAISKKLKSKFYFDYDISKNIWFRTGGKALIFCIVYDSNELEIILKNIGNMNYEILGAGSNILVRDNGFDGIIFKLGKKFNKIILHNSFIEVGAGILDINLSKFAQLYKIKNFEFYSGIPGSIGGAVKMNAGCYGSETKDILKDVKIINSKCEFKNLSKKQIHLSYRSSSLQQGDIVISANYHCFFGDKEEISKKVNEIKLKRKDSQPLKTKTSGSTFKNPKNNYAAKLIEMADCKNLNVGDAYVSDKHANFIINTNNATAKQIEELGNRIIDKVFDKFNIRLEWEIKIIGS
jgi:UDP-N-acetylmuramate dehydrogenase